MASSLASAAPTRVASSSIPSASTSAGGGNNRNSTGTCYQKSNNKIRKTKGTLCGTPADDNDFVQCCQEGDTCLPNHFCYFSHTLPGASGFYVALCSDPDYKDTDACSDRCGKRIVLTASPSLGSTVLSVSQADLG